MTADEIRAAIAADPALQALVPDTQAIAAALSVGRTRYVETQIGVGTIIEVLGFATANAVLDVIYSAPDYRHVKPHWTVIDIDADPAQVLALLDHTLGQRYGWLDLLTQQVLRLPVDDAGWFCSEWCAAGIGLTDPEIWSPGMLARHYGVI